MLKRKGVKKRNANLFNTPSLSLIYKIANFLSQTTFSCLKHELLSYSEKL